MTKAYKSLSLYKKDNYVPIEPLNDSVITLKNTNDDYIELHKSSKGYSVIT